MRSVRANRIPLEQQPARYSPSDHHAGRASRLEPRGVPVALALGEGTPAGDLDGRVAGGLECASGALGAGAGDWAGEAESGE